MDWTVEDEEVDWLNIGVQHGRLFVLLRNTHRPQKKPYPICTTRSGEWNTGAEAGKTDPCSSLKGHSGRVGEAVGDENAESCGVVRPLRIALVIRPLRRTYVVVVR